MKKRRRFIFFVPVVILPLILIFTSAFAPLPGGENTLQNGDFEGGFGGDGVATAWSRFQNEGQACYSWHDDTWNQVVYDGEHSQLLEINTLCEGISPQAGDLYIGIYQRVAVVPDATYQFTMHGLVRSTEGSPEASAYGYRIQWGMDYDGGSDWTQVTDWIDVGWDDQPREGPTLTMNSHTANVTATSDHLTVFIRGWRKWGHALSEGDFNVDGISLVGPVPGVTATPSAAPTPTPTPIGDEVMPPTGLGLPILLGGGVLAGVLVMAKGIRVLLATTKR
jgi:hypothetical protein